MEKVKFTRANTPPPMRFQKRDGQILRAIYTHDGVLARRQIRKLFWPKASVQAMERRLSLLFHNSFLDWPGPEQRRLNPIPEPVIWLGWRGIFHIAEGQGLDITPPSSEGEHQLRLFNNRLHKKEIRWQREPRWSQLAHDIAVNDFRMVVEEAAVKWPSLSLETWITEGEFYTDMDVISISEKDAKGKPYTRKKGIRPDGFFILVDHLRQINNSPARGRFLLEFDNGNHSLSRFGKDKVLPGIQYIRSAAYKKRFGFNSGQWLIVCNGTQRMFHLKHQVEKSAGKDASLFLFTTLNQVNPDSVFNEPVWLRGGSQKMESLVKTISAVQP